jgi:AcrR family transcriptional regulator
MTQIPPPREKRQRLGHAQRRAQLVDACAFLIATKGYSNTSVRDIAAKVGISTGTLLHHFTTKEELLRETLISISEDFQSNARAAAARVADPSDKLRAVVRSVLASPHHDTGWRVWIAFWHEAALRPELSSTAVTRNELWEDFLAELILEGQSSGSFTASSADDRASELAALINGVAIQRFGEARRWTSERAIAVVERLFVDWNHL